MTTDDADRVAGPTCHDDVCITCSDTAVEVRITEVRQHGLALVETGTGDEEAGQEEARQEEVSIALVSADVGDTILVHAGEAIAVIHK